MLMTSIPFIGMYLRKFHTWYHNKIHHKCHKESCQETHAEHPYQSVPQSVKCSHGKKLTENCPNCIDWAHDGSSWDELPYFDAEEKFGQAVIADLLGATYFDLLADPPVLDEFMWLVNGEGQLQARWFGRIFLLEMTTNTWSEYII